MATAAKTPAEIFLDYAGADADRWLEARQLSVTHSTFGVGTIVSIDDFVHVQFADGEKRFEPGLLANGRFFVDMGLPAHLETAAIRKQREKSGRERFAELRKEYRADAGDEQDKELQAVLMKVHAGNRLSEAEVEWLETRGYFAALASLYQKLYRKNKQPWDAIAAGDYWRRDGNAVKALDWLKRVQFNTPREEAARLTLRGLIHRDGGALDRAERCADRAIALEESYQPFNLLGGIALDRGDLEAATAHFERATALGSSSEAQDAEIRASVLRSSGPARERLTEYLRERDPVRYEWILNPITIDLGNLPPVDSSVIEASTEGATGE